MRNEKGFAPIILILGVIVILAVGVGGYWFLNKQSSSTTSTNQSVNQPTISTNNTGFRVAGDKIFKGNELLFVNVKGVKEARLGPDNNTIHFKTDGSKDAKFCANLATKIEPSSYDYPSPPPQQSPWDYQRVGHAYTIGDCG